MTFFSSLFCLIHPSIHPWSWRQRLSPLSFSACLRLFISKGMFRKRYCLSWFSQKRSPCILLFKWGLKLIPPLFLLHFHPSWLNQAIILKGNFRLFVTSPLRSLPATFGEERAKPLDQSNLFLTHFHSQGLPLQEERDRNKSEKKKKRKKEIWHLGTGNLRKKLQQCLQSVGMRFRSPGACSRRLGSQQTESVI